MAAENPYKVLSVERGATEADVKKAYRKLAKELHPDKNKDNPKAAERFSAATTAYDLLSDKDKRARFDRGEIDGDGNPTSPFGGGFNGGGRGGGDPFAGFRQAGGQPGAQAGFDDGSDFGDIFEGLFGGRKRAGGGGFGRSAPPPKGANVSYRLLVAFDEAARLAPQRITLSDGKTIDLKLPNGVENGTQMRLSGKGQHGAGGYGDAIVTIEIGTHPFFRRDGNAVRLDLPLRLSEAVLGADVKVPTVDGSVMIKVPAGASSGRTLRLKDRGFTAKDGTRGDQLVTLQIEVPKDDATLNDWAAANKDRGGNPRSKLGV